MDAQTIAKENLLFLTLSGSHAYGMATETSDNDYRGIFYAPREITLSGFKNIEQVEGFAGEKDSTVFEIRKYIKLLADMNPNILELLWVDEKFMKLKSIPYSYLRGQRNVFLSSKAKHTFSGYAMSQLKRIKGHNKWINNPQPKRRPKEIDFLSIVWNSTSNKEWNTKVPLEGFEAFELGGNIYGLRQVFQHNARWYDTHEAIVSTPITELVGKGHPEIIVKFNKQLYTEAVDNWKHYWDWKENRNEKRSELEEKYGYDTKHASHLIRLLRMGVEILRGDGVRVLRPDAEELLAIRNGLYTYEQIVSMANGLEANMEYAYSKTELPHSVDQNKADSILLDLHSTCWGMDANPFLKGRSGIGYKNVGLGS